MSMNIDQEKPHKSICGKIIEWATKRFEHKDPAKWIKDMKTSIGITVSIIATITFSLATNPPGGVVQISLNDGPFSENDPFCSNKTGINICAGEAILATAYEDIYLPFLVCNTICFVAALSVLLLLVSGILRQKTFLVWCMLFGMWVTLSSLALTYLFAVFMVTPNSIWRSLLENGFGIVMVFWVSIVALLAGVLSAFLVVRFIVRAIHKVWNCMGCK